MTYAIPDDVAAALGRATDSLTDTERAQWQVWLDMVERAIRRGFRRAGLDLDAQIATGEPTAEDVADVEVAAVVRKVQNPTWGLTSSTRSLDDGSITTRSEGGNGANPLDLLDGEWSALLPERAGGAFSIRPAYAPDRLCPPDPWS